MNDEFIELRSDNKTSSQINDSIRIGIFLILFVLSCIPIFLTPVIPTVDYYDHINRYYVLSNINSNNFLEENYVENWSVIPNIGLDVIGVQLLNYVSPELSSKVVIILIFLVQYTGILFFSRSISGKLSWITGLLAIPLLYSFVFSWGFANFLLGLGLAMWGGALWLTLRDRLILATFVGVVTAITVFLTHGLAFALYGLLLGGLELGFFWARHRDWRVLFSRLALLALQAIAPVLLFLVSATVGSGNGVTNAADAVSRLAMEGKLTSRLVEIAQYRVQTLFRVAEGPSPWFDAVTFTATVLLVGLLVRRGCVTIPKVVWPALLIAAVLVLITPPAMFGVGYVADRMPLFLAFLVVGSLTLRGIPRSVDMAIIGALVLLVVGRISWIAYDWRGYAQDFESYSAVASKIPPQKVVAYINVNLESRLVSSRRCEMYGPLLISLYGQASPLFAIPTAQPLRLTGRLLAGLSHLPQHERFTVPEERAYHNAVLAKIAEERHFDYVLLCDAARLQRGFPAGAVVVAARDRFTLLKVR